MMGIFFIYTVKSSLCLAAFYLFYKWLLSRETFHRFNRFALLGLLMLSAVLPLVEVGVKRPVPMQQPLLTLEQWLMPVSVSEEVSVAQPDTPLWLQTLLILYGVGVVFFLLRNLWSLGRLVLLLRAGRFGQVEDYLPGAGRGMKLVVHEHQIAPFSWMRFIVISRKDLEENGREILIHERAHIRLGHSWDVLLADLCCFVQWFNPAAWLLKRELQSVHEYEADEAVLREGVNAKEYQLLLIKKAVGTRLYSMANSLNHSSLKKRITMMMKKRSNPWARMKYAYVLPLAALTMTAFARPEVSQVTHEISSAKVTNLVENLQASRAEIAPKDSICAVVDVMPEFPGGMQAMMEFLKNNLRYPEELKAKGTQGNVVVQFVVDKEGSLTDVQVLRSVHPQMDAEAIRVVKAMPRWKPGMQDGKAVAVKYTVPVVFANTSGWGLAKGDVIVVGGGKGNPPKQLDADKALLVVDGEVKEGMQRNELKADEISSIIVLKDEEAVRKYGEKGKDGVIEVSTKASAYDAEGNLKVQGLVTDEQGEPIIGAVIVIAGSQKGVVSDMDGKFMLSAPKDATLEVGYVGYAWAKVKAEPVVTVKLTKE